jgi:serine/threonine protein kinase/tetratricopeptide (TPR) repeat protein
MTEHAKDAEAIFLAALDRATPQGRVAYVEATCAGDPELLRRVRELLSCHEGSLGLLDAPPPGLGCTVDMPATSELPGTVIGPYKLLQQIGEGGMGTVYMAEQTRPVRRKVALKVIKPGMDSRQVIARFEAERQALAMMDHVNIARVLDGGATESGRPYFVMELVHGVPITKYCDDNHLTPRQRLELFVPVCQAIQHAHQKGIIHRDIKPSNVMITLYDGKPVPKVIDFGVAKATEQNLTERTLFTQYGALVGTLEYMSPEQAEMSAQGVDTRSDIFSLGVLLYELLTGSTPLSRKRVKEAAFAEILRLIREEEPPRPSTRLSDSGEALASISAQRHMEPARLTKLVRGELDWIVMKTLEKDRNRRYETANGLAMDVQHYLADEPVQACPPSVGYRLRKFARRNRTALATAAVVATALVAGTTISTWQAVRAGRAEHAARSAAVHAKTAEKQANQERDEALVQRQRAEERFRLAFQAVRKMNGLYRNLRSVAGPEQTVKMQSAVKKDLLQFYTHIIENNADDFSFAYEVAESCFFMSDLSSSVDPVQSDRLLLKARALYERAARDSPEDTSALGALANTHLFLGTRYLERDQVEQAEAAFRRSLEIFERLARIHPDHADDWFLICNLGAWDFGRMRRFQGRPAEAEALDRRILALFERPEFDLNWFERRPASRAMSRDEGYDGYMALSDLLIRCGQPLKAIPILARARLHLVFNEDYRYYRSVLANLSLSLAMDPDPSARARAVMVARENVELTAEPDAEASRVLRLVLAQKGDLQGADDAFRLGNALAEQHRLDEAIAWHHKAIELDPKHVKAHNALGNDLYGQRKLDEAIAWYRKAIELDPKSVIAWQCLGWVQYRAGNWKASIEALEKSCILQNPGDFGQWIVMSLAHWKLAIEKDLPEQERDRHMTEARRWYDHAVKQIGNRVWGEKLFDQALQAFLKEAAELLGVKVKQE